MVSSQETNSIAGAFGSIIGYLGGEVGEPAVFEQLLWPQRFHNHVSAGTMLQSALMQSMGGPLHKAALETLDAFRRKGLYRGMQQGHMLGTAFYSDSKLRYKLHAYSGIDNDVEVRNGMWAIVLQRVNHYQKERSKIGSNDPESNEPKSGLRRRTTQKVQHLRLQAVEAGSNPCPDTVTVSLDTAGISVLFSILASESMALLCAIIIIVLERGYGFAAYLCFPLILKFLAVFFSVRREPLVATTTDALIEPSSTIVLEIQDYDNGFPVIEGSEDVVRQFFRHWGHPIRESRMDRVKEVMSMCWVLGFVFNFPMGLLSMLWTSQSTQVTWLSYQMFTVVVMHLNRLCGLDGPGRIEDTIAKELAANRRVRLESKGRIIEARLESHFVGRIADGREKVMNIVKEHVCSLREKTVLG